MARHPSGGPDVPGRPSFLSRDRVVAVVVLAATAFFWYESAKIATDEARFFPRVILGGIGALALVLLLRGPREAEADTTEPIVTAPFAFTVFLGASLAYAVAVSFFGYFTSTVVFVPAVALLLGLRRPVIIAATTVVFTGFVYLAFVTLFKRPLPPEFFAG